MSLVTLRINGATHEVDIDPYYSSDYPFERMQDASDWFDNTTVLTDEQRQRIGRDNAIRLFDLDA